MKKLLFQKILEKLLKKAEKKTVSNNPQNSAIKTKDPWWVILLKILSYIISLILGGVVTSCAPHVL